MIPFDRKPDLNIRGVTVWKGLIPPDEQAAMVDDLRAVATAAPFVTHVTPGGKPMSVRMTAAGDFGWVSDRRGYRYAPVHPNGTPWPAIPERIMQVWRSVSECPRDPECCLVNYYGEDAKMGLHQDRDEADFTAPVVSISLGDAGRFRIGNLERGGTTESLWLESGDVLVMGGPARLVYHGIDRIRAGSSRLLPQGGRINLTLRVVT